MIKNIKRDIELEIEASKEIVKGLKGEPTPNMNKLFPKGTFSYELPWEVIDLISSTFEGRRYEGSDTKLALYNFLNTLKKQREESDMKELCIDTIYRLFLMLVGKDIKRVSFGDIEFTNFKGMVEVLPPTAFLKRLTRFIGKLGIDINPIDTNEMYEALNSFKARGESISLTPIKGAKNIYNAYNSLSKIHTCVRDNYASAYSIYDACDMTLYYFNDEIGQAKVLTYEIITNNGNKVKVYDTIYALNGVIRKLTVNFLEDLGFEDVREYTGYKVPLDNSKFMVENIDGEACFYMNYMDVSNHLLVSPNGEQFLSNELTDEDVASGIELFHVLDADYTVFKAS